MKVIEWMRSVAERIVDGHRNLGKSMRTKSICRGSSVKFLTRLKVLVRSSTFSIHQRMPFKNDKSTTKLPAALRDELGLDLGSVHSTGPSRGRGYGNRGGDFNRGGPSSRGKSDRRTAGSVIGRKDARRAERDARKQRPQHTDNGLSDRAKGKKRQLDDNQGSSSSNSHSRGQASKKARVAEEEEVSEVSHSDTDPDGPAKPQKVSALQKLLDKSQTTKSNSSRSGAAGQSQHKRNRSHLTQAEKDEEDEIAWLEAMLGGAGKGKGKTKQADEDAVQDTDGFDDLLTDLDRFYPGMYGDDDATSGESSIFEETSDEDSASQSESDISGTDDEFAGFSGIESSKSEEESNPASESIDKVPKEASTTDSGPAPAALPIASGSKYVPPAARIAAAAAAAQASSDGPSSAVQDLERQKLRRQLQGLLNRLGDSNLDSILTSIEEVYRSNRRAEVSTTLTRLILDTIAMRSNLILTDTFVVVYASLVASLGRIVGMEFVAGLVSDLVADLLKFYRQAKADELREVAQQYGGPDDSEEAVSGSSKALANLVVLLSHMYNLHVVACPLIYDLIKLFLHEIPTGQDLLPTAAGGVSELDVESLLKVVKTCGTQLRSDDASALKQIAAIAVAKTDTTSSTTVKSSSRTRFMLETLNNLNKASSRPGKYSADDNTSAGAMLVQMKKYLGSMEKKRSTRRWEALRIGLKDLQDAERRGKWWLVGGVWKDEDQVGDAAPPPRGGKDVREEDEEDSQLAQLSALARQHGMNTPARRQIFTTIMSSPDYVTAASNVLGLSLTAIQQREIIRVLLHCTAREATYNPYYSLIGMQLAQGEMKKGISITMQFCLWDYLRSIGERSVGGHSVARDQGDDDGERFGDEDDDDATTDAQKDIKMWHLARCYAFWVSRSTIDLTILRPVPFASLRSSRTRTFLQVFFLHLVLSSQTASPTLNVKGGDWSKESKKRGSLEKVFIYATTNNTELLMGLHLFFSTEMSPGKVAKLVGGEIKKRESMNKDKDTKTQVAQTALENRVAWCVEVVKEILEVGLQSATRSL